MLVIVPKFHGHVLSLSYDFLIFSFLIKSLIRCILIVKVQNVIKLGLGNQFGHGDARFWTHSQNLTPKPNFESQISNFQLLILIFSPK